jgi:hypothetical protein
MAMTTEERKKALYERIATLHQQGKGKDLVYPSLLRMARNLAGSMAEAAKEALLTGDLVVEEEEFLDRMEVCIGCAIFDPAEIRCTDPSCGCFLNIKARMAAMYCPQYKWPGDQEKALFS